MALVKKIQIGKILLEKNIITQQQLDTAMQEQKNSGRKLGQVLIDLGYIKEDNLYDILSQQLGIPFIELKHYAINKDVVHLLPERNARRLRCMVLNKDSNGLLVGIVDPQDIFAIDELTAILKEPIHFAMVRESDLLKMIDLYYRHTEEISSLAGELSAELGENDFDISKLGIGTSHSDAPVVKLIQTIFEDAVQVNASDVHIEPGENLLRIRNRIDGVLHEQILKENVAPALTQRLKLMAGLNIAEKRLPQDGRFSIKIKNNNYDVRLSTLPVQYGESVVMRLLNQSGEALSLTSIGMPEHMLERLRIIDSLPNGLLIITGPTGSGKTTTLYGVLNELNDPAIKIITVEDPVEYRIGRINQVQIQSNIELTFARALRAILRQDPDIIMIGELRDQETVAIAIRAAMTGHFVFSTLHTNDAISSAIRLIDMGVEGYLIATVLRAIIAQRLVRRICQNCIVDTNPTPQQQIWLSSIEGFHYSGQIFKKGMGCTYCHNTGYKGQIGIFEMLELNTGLGNALRNNDTAAFIRIAKTDTHFKSLILSGLELVVNGTTTIDEIIRVTGGELAEDTEKNADVLTKTQ
ncbi:MAG: Flp pilus assembly complex ATPase component TadA, partial [Gammaproteobacteria bacterium]|nr:Flp pilus assembly complex ATPase component TadA [Gammaproteobacteria bacterium]